MINYIEEIYICENRRSSGITLIVLVITIIVLIILATISINIIFSDEGIFDRARSAKEKQMLAEEQERLELIKANTALNNNGKVDVEKYIQEVLRLGITTKENITSNTDGSKNFITDKGYEVNVKEDKDNENNVIITIKGKAGAVGEALGAITFGELEWNSTTHTASVSITKTTEDNYGIKYEVKDKSENVIQKNQTMESEITASELKLDDVVYVYLWDGRNTGNNPAILNIEDMTVPNEADISLSETSINTTGSVIATVTQSDDQSGVDIESCRWVLNTDSATTIEESLYPSENTINKETSATITLTSTTPETYYLHILTVDKAGNKTQTISNPITITQLVTEVTLDKTSTTIAAGKTQTLTATITPTNASNNTVTWSSNNTEVATVNSSGVVTGVSNGTAIITATANDGTGKSDSCTVTVVSNWTTWTSSSACTVTLKNPSSTTNPTILNIASTTEEAIHSRIKYTGTIKTGDVISFTFSVTRSGSYYINLRTIGNDETTYNDYAPTSTSVNRKCYDKDS